MFSFYIYTESVNQKSLLITYFASNAIEYRLPVTVHPASCAESNQLPVYGV